MLKEVFIPDIGDYSDVDVIELAVAEGDVVEFDQTILTLETDKATMDIPCPFAGKISKLNLAVGDKASQGTLMLVLEAADNALEIPTKVATEDHNKTEESIASTTVTTTAPVVPAAPSTPLSPVSTAPAAPAPAIPAAAPAPAKAAYAGPFVRRFARLLGVDLTKVTGTGRKGRISHEDVQNYVKQALQNPTSGGGNLGFDLPAMAKIDFQKFGPIEYQPLSRIKKISGAYLHRNWLHIPHVTHFEDVDSTKLENFRKTVKALADKQGVKLTPLIFIMKAIVAGMQEFPHFNASLDPSGDQLILKKYFHIGVAVDTPNGLVVPVVRDVDKKDIFQLAHDLTNLSQKAREGKLTATDMQGGCFSISSLGGIGGRAFTPIVNAPEVAILGVSKASMQPVFIDGKFEPRLMLPLSLSYDHRVIDGAEAARFASLVRQKIETFDDLLK